MISFREQIRSNSLALISLTVAFIALGYNTWRNETTESHRNVREASFRVLESLGELQEVADHRYYYFPFENNEGREGELRLRGFGQVAMVRDLMNLMPAPAPDASDDLFQLRNESFNALAELDEGGRHSETAKEVEKELGDAILKARASVITILEMLD
jgi:hypothetical protein